MPAGHFKHSPIHIRGFRIRCGAPATFQTGYCPQRWFQHFYSAFSIRRCWFNPPTSKGSLSVVDYGVHGGSRPKSKLVRLRRFKIETAAGVEPARLPTGSNGIRTVLAVIMELPRGIEPPTCWLQVSCSTYWATIAWWCTQMSKESFFSWKGGVLTGYIFIKSPFFIKTGD